MPNATEHITTSQQAIDVWKEFDDKFVVVVGNDNEKENNLRKSLTQSEVKLLDLRIQSLDEKKQQSLLRLINLWKEKTRKNTRTVLDLKRSYSSRVNHFFAREHDDIRKKIANYFQLIWKAQADGKEHKVEQWVTNLLRDYNRALWQANGEKISADFLQQYTKRFLAEKAITPEIKAEILSLQATLEKAERSLNFKKIFLLESEMKKGNWTHEIFNDPELPFYAMTLYVQNKISHAQITSVLYRRGVEKDFGITNTFPILDETGEFTAEAEEWLLPLLRNHILTSNFNRKELESFRLLVQQLPRSEQYFFLSNKTPKHKLISGVLNLENLGSVYATRSAYVHMAFGATEALTIARYGVKHYILPITRLGSLGIRDIEEGVRREARYAALSYPHPKIHEDIHGYDVYDFIATAHDVSYHAVIMSAMPEYFRKALLRITDITREAVAPFLQKAPKEIWSKDIWNLIDAEYGIFYWKFGVTNKPSTNEKKTQIFEEGFIYRGPLLPEGNLTLVGAITFLDMLKNKNEWMELGIEPKYFLKQFSDNFTPIQKIYPVIANENPAMQVLKVFAYLNLVEFEREYLWEELNKLIDAHLEIIKEVIFAKTSMRSNENPNTLCLNFSGKSLNPLNAFGAIVEKLECPDVDAKYQKEYLRVREEGGAKINEAQDYIRLRQTGKSVNDARFAAMPTVRNWAIANPALFMFFALSVVLVIPLLVAFITIAASIYWAKRELAIRNGNQLQDSSSAQAPVFQPVVVKDGIKAEEISDVPSEEKSPGFLEEKQAETKDTPSNFQMGKK